MKQYHSIPKILENIDKKKYQVPDDWCYEEARKLFITPEILDPKDITVGKEMLIIEQPFLFVY